MIFRATSRKRTLYHIQNKKHFRATNGAAGQGKKKNGRQGDPLIIDLPVGTLIFDESNGDQLHDLTESDQEVIIAAGGRGGKGNHHFKTATHRAPRFAQPGEPGQTMPLKLVLKLMADVGIIGLPNAGKSTLISALSSARPKIAEYPFTTLTPILGVVKMPDGEPIVMADIPGLIEGAHDGAGMGIQFLRHIERTRILLHLIDAGAIDPDHPLRDYETVIQELHEYGGTLAEKPQIVVLNKMDLPEADEKAALFRKSLAPGTHIICISAAARTGIKDLLPSIHQILYQLDEESRQNSPTR